MKLSAIRISIVLLALAATADPIFANRTGVEVSAPASAQKGSTVTVTIRVSHDGNNFFHHTDRVELAVNGKPFKNWEYGSFSRPDAGEFTLTVTVPVDGDITLTARGNCNLHGSRGPVSATVKAQ